MIVAKFRVRIRAHCLYISAAVLYMYSVYQLSCEDPYIWSQFVEFILTHKKNKTYGIMMII